MKYMIIILLSILFSCSSETEIPGYQFDNFQNTPVWDLAKAVKENNVRKMKQIHESNLTNIDYKDPFYQKTLLALAIVNKKDMAFLELLKLGSNPNEIIGKKNEATPLLCALDFQENCNLFYIDALLKYGADPNLKIEHKDQDILFEGGIPLFHAIGKTDNNGGDCINVIDLLLKKGAKIDTCYNNPITQRCESIITKCLETDSMELLKYFIIEKKIEIPNIVYSTGGININTMKTYSLVEILNTEDFNYENYPTAKKAKDDILDYLKNDK